MCKSYALIPNILAGLSTSQFVNISLNTCIKDKHVYYTFVSVGPTMDKFTANKKSYRSQILSVDIMLYLLIMDSV